MKDNEFYQKYANIPLAERLKKIPDPDDGVQIRLNEIYAEIYQIDDKIRQDVIRKEHLIRAFEKYFLQANQPLEKED